MLWTRMSPLSYHMPARIARSSCRTIRLTGSAHGDNMFLDENSTGGTAVADFVRVASVSDVSPGEVMVVAVDGDRVALVNVDGELYAIADECSHEGCPLSEGDVDGRMLVCPCHGSDFDVTTGEPATPPAYEPVATYAVRVDGDDVLVAPSG